MEDSQHAQEKSARLRWDMVRCTLIYFRNVATHPDQIWRNV